MARHMIELIGKVRLVDLKVKDVQSALGKLAERVSTRSVRLARMILIQAIRNAMVNRGAECGGYGHHPRRKAGMAAVAVCRSVRRTQETRTGKSRRVFQIPGIAEN
jgi:hypothetical protein